jgi:energy-coupling factor transport system substrate-specific component
LAQETQFRAQRFTTLDLVIIAVLGVVFGILNTPFGVIFQFIQATFGPLAQSMFAPWAISMILSLYIVRKPGAGFINGLINGLFQVLSGNPAGLVNMGWGFALGLGSEVGVALDQYFSGTRRFTWVTALLAGAIANLFSFAVTAIAFNYLAAGVEMLLGSWVAQTIAGSIESGLVALLLGGLLAQSGLLKSFEAGRGRRPAAA